MHTLSFISFNSLSNFSILLSLSADADGGGGGGVDIGSSSFVSVVKCNTFKCLLIPLHLVDVVFLKLNGELQRDTIERRNVDLNITLLLAPFVLKKL